MHAELIAGAVTTALMNLSLQNKIPILHEVLVVKNDQQATERCLLPKINRGVEAARARDPYSQRPEQTSLRSRLWGKRRERAEKKRPYNSYSIGT